MGGICNRIVSRLRLQSLSILCTLRVVQCTDIVVLIPANFNECTEVRNPRSNLH